MKKAVINEAHRIMDLMGRVNLVELNQRYLDQLLDKISDSGMDSLSDYEKMSLEKLSNNQDVAAPDVKSLYDSNDALRFTVIDRKTGQPQVSPEDMGQLRGQSMYKKAYVVGGAELIAGFDQVKFIDGDLSELDKHESDQRIVMILPDREYECVATVSNDNEVQSYLIRLKDDEEDYEDGGFDELLGMNEEDMSEYKVFDSGEMNEPLDMTEGNAFVGAAKKAKEEGKDSFELNGKSYKVTVSKSK